MTHKWFFFDVFSEKDLQLNATKYDELFKPVAFGKKSTLQIRMDRSNESENEF